MLRMWSKLLLTILLVCKVCAMMTVGPSNSSTVSSRSPSNNSPVSTQSPSVSTTSSQKTTSRDYNPPSFGTAVWVVIILITLACIAVLLVALVFAIIVYRYRTKIAKAERQNGSSKRTKKRKLFRTATV